MQQESERRSNRQRTEATRAELIAAARKLFVEKSYAGTGTPEIAAEAGLTRGALYHHFADKQDLFRAVVKAEAARVAEEIDNATAADMPPRQALIRGGEAFFEAMREPGRTRLLLLDGPAVLGRAEMDAIDGRHGMRTLREGLALAMANRAMRRMPLEAATALISAIFDRAALAIDAGASAADYRAAVKAVIEGLMREPG